MELDAYIESTSENAALDFKAAFDPSSSQEWCEILKDIVAISNSGGGCILIGREDDGGASSFDVEPVLDLDPAEITDKIGKYTGCVYSDFEIRRCEFNGQKLACILLGPCRIPMVFTKPGTYQVVGTNNQKSAFSQGAVYFRHGAKSEPGTTEDLRLSIEREIARIRNEWLGNIKKVVEAPIGSQFIVVSEHQKEMGIPVETVRLTTDPSAPLVRELDHNITHPYRQKELIQTVNSRLNGAFVVTGHDLITIRKIYQIEERPEFFYKPLFSSPTYSEAFADWIVLEAEKDKEFFDKARKHYRVQMDVSQKEWVEDSRILWLKEFMRQTGLGLTGVSKRIRISPSTVSRILQGTYNGNRMKMLGKIESMMASEVCAKGNANGQVGKV